MQGSPIALAFFGLTVGAWAASSAFRPDNKDTFQDTECISIHFKASVEGCQNHPKSREFPWNKFLGSLTPSALKPTNYSPTRVRPVVSFNCTTQSGSSVNLVVCKCNSWQLWFNWVEPALCNMTSTQDVHLEREKQILVPQVIPKIKHQQNHTFLPIVSTLSSKDSSCDILWGNDSNGLKLKKSSFDREISSSDWQTLRSGSCGQTDSNS